MSDVGDTCNVSGCGKPATSFLQLRIPLDDGEIFSITMPRFFCEDCRGTVAVRSEAMTDQLWAEIEKLVPEGRLTGRTVVEIATVDKIAVPDPPPEIAAALDRLMLAATAFGQMPGGGPVRAHAAAEAAARAEACARILRNYPGGAIVERQTAAESMLAAANAFRTISKRLGRNEVEAAGELVPELNARFYKCRQLTAVAILALGSPQPS